MGEHSELHRRPEHRQGEERLHHRAQPRVGGESGRDSERDPQNSHLAAEQQRSQRERARSRAERHPDPDLAALRLDRAADEIERGERRRSEQQRGEDVHHLLIAFGVLVEQATRGLLAAGGERESGAWHYVSQRAVELGLDLRERGAALDSEDELVDPAVLAAQRLRGPKRGEHDGESGLRSEVRARGGDDEVLRAERLADVGHFAAAGEPDRACCRQPVVLGEVALELDDRPPVVRGSECPSSHRRERVHWWIDRGANDPAGNDDALPAAGGIDLSRDHEALLGGRHQRAVRNRCQRLAQPALGHVAARREGDAKVMHP